MTTEDDWYHVHLDMTAAFEELRKCARAIDGVIERANVLETKQDDLRDSLARLEQSLITLSADIRALRDERLGPAERASA